MSINRWKRIDITLLIILMVLHGARDGIVAFLNINIVKAYERVAEHLAPGIAADGV